MHPTMDDIARACGVSKMTVSRVLAGRQGASQGIREKVLSVAKHLQYESNVQAANFAQRRSGFVGVVTPFEGLMGSSYLADIFKGFQQVVPDSGRDFALFDLLAPSFSDGAKLEKLYRSRKVDGLLVVAPHTDDRFLDTLAGRQVLLVVVGERVDSSGVSGVVCDDAQGIVLACEHLHGLGHRRIAFVGGPPRLSTARRREGAYGEFCRARGLRLPAGFSQAGGYTLESGYAAGRRLLAGGREDQPSAVVVANDMMALGVLEAAREAGLDVPGELSVTGFDDLAIPDGRPPVLTTVHQPVVEMAAQAARLLVGALESGREPDRQIVLPVHLVERASTAAPARA